MIELTHPWFFTLLFSLPLLALALRRSLTNMTQTQRWVCLAIRALLLALLIFAVVGVRFRMNSNDLAVLYLVDDSTSISDEARKQARDFIESSLPTHRAGDEVGIVGFARHAEVWQPAANNPRLAEKWPELADRAGTDIGKALEFASAIFPTQKAKRLVLLGDGNDTGDRAAEAARKLAASGIQLLTVPLRNAQRPEVLVEEVETPRRLKTGEPFDLTAKIRSNLATTAAVKLYQNQFLIKQTDLDIKPGTNTAVFRNLKAEGSFVAYEVEIVPAQDTMLENNRAQATVSLRGEPRVLIVDGDESKAQPLAGALRLEKMTVEVRGQTGMPKTLEDLQQFDLFMLSDVSSLNLTREQMELYRVWVQDFGGGFVMLGGENSFGVGGYYKTPVEQMLPVRMEHEDRIDTPSVALLVALDRSGSMAAQVQGQTKMSLADQGAVFAMDVLQPRDLFGVTAVDTRVHIVAPLAKPDNKSAIAQRIMAITAGGGGIYIYTSLVDAFQQLRDVNAKIKHFILFSDAADAEEKAAGEMADGTRLGGSSEDVVAAMLAGRITTSVVGLGLESDKDVEFLKKLAERGNGRFYLTNDALSLPQIFSTETMRVAQSSLVEEPFAAVQAMPSPILDGIDWKQSPLLLGYNATKPKPTGEVLLATERGEPLLATWRYGLGQTAAFTSDAKSRWASEWLAWPGFGKFWAQLVRAMMRKSDQSNFKVTTNESGDRLMLKIDAVTPDGKFRNQLPITINCLGPNGEKQTRQAEQDAPGSYTASFDLPAEGTSIFSLSSPQLPEGEYVFGHTRSYPKEFLTTDTNEALLRQLAEAGGGEFDPKADAIFKRPRQMSARYLDLTPYFLSLALILFPIDIWMRRRSWS